MRGNEFLDKLELVSPAYIEAADVTPIPKKNRFTKWAAMAACLAIVAAAVIPTILRGSAPTPPTPVIPPVQQNDNDSSSKSPDSDRPREPWTAYFNEVKAADQLDSTRLNIPGYFTEKLTEEEISLVTPEKAMNYMEYSGFGGFDGEGTLLGLYLTVTTTLPDCPVRIAVDDTFRDCLIMEEPVISACGDVKYSVYQLKVSDDAYYLEADAEISGHSFTFSMSVNADELETAKMSFQEILECFARYGEGKPDLSSITPTAIPEYFDKPLTLSEAQADPDFGGYMLKSVPTGFSEESIRRYKDYQYDYLSGLWTKGMSELRWQVSAYSEADEARLTSVEDTENYDLSLYPIPLAESVPSDKWEIVNNPIFDAEELTLETVYKRAYKVNDSGDTGGWRMSFSVKYGDIIVKVTAKGVSPDWVYDELVEIKSP